MYLAPVRENTRLSSRFAEPNPFRQVPSILSNSRPIISHILHFNMTVICKCVFLSYKYFVHFKILTKKLCYIFLQAKLTTLLPGNRLVYWQQIGLQNHYIPTLLRNNAFGKSRDTIVIFLANMNLYSLLKKSLKLKEKLTCQVSY